VTRLISRRHVLTGAAALSTAAILPRTSLGADWRPTETVRLIVPAAPGGTTDVMGRLLAAHLQTAWGQSAIVENRSGGGGTIGTSEVVRSKGDGHVILVGNPGPNAIAYSIFKNMTYKPDQLQPVSNLIRIPNIISAHPSVPIKSIPDMIAYIKANPDKLTYGSSGVGQSPHLTMAWLLQLTGLKVVHVPFRGAGPALQAALGGDIQILSDNLYPTLPQVQEGKLNALAVTTPERSALAPNIRPCAKPGRNWRIRRLVLVRHLPAESAPAPCRRRPQQGDQGVPGARGHQDPSPRSAHAPITAPRSSIPISSRRRPRSSPASSRRRTRWR
jgi:tripartite-type tricarboxylate transporter receptor subunit TctC